MKKTLSVLLALVMVFSAIPLGGLSEYIKNVDFGFISIKASAANESDLSFELNDDGESYCISDCNEEASGSLTIPSTYNGKPVTAICLEAFYYCGSITSVTIPDSVKSIGECAFYGCESLSAITIPDSITGIGYDAFSGTAYYDNSSNWENGVLYIGNHIVKAKEDVPASYTIKSGTKCIAEEAFCECNDLISVMIPDSIISIGESAFLWCGSLTELNVSTDNKNYFSIDGVLFSSSDSKLICCPAGKSGSYTIPDNILSIGDYSFAFCNNLTSVAISDSVTNIGDVAFYNCVNLTSTTIPDSVTNIGDLAFYNCNSLKFVAIPDNVTNIGYEAFGFVFDEYEGCDLLIQDFTIYSRPNTAAKAYADENGICWINTCTHENTEKYDAVTALSCTQPGYTAGVYCLDCNTWISGHEKTYIAHTDENFDYVCDVCGNWVCEIIPGETKSVDINEGKKALLEFTPYENEIYVFTSHSSDDTYGYLYDSEMNELANDDDSGENNNFKVEYMLEAGKTYYFGAKYWNSSKSGSLNVSLSVYSPFYFTLNDDGTYNVSGYNEEKISGAITIPSKYNGKSVTGIGEYAFSRYSSITMVTIPDSVTTIGDYAFSWCSNLTSVTIPDSVMNIGCCAFYNSNKLESVSIGSGVTSIGDAVFQCCSNLSFINVSTDNKKYSSIDGVLFNKSKTTLICCPEGIKGAYTIPDIVTDIGDFAFRGCENLTTVTIPESVTSIGDSAFCGCSGFTAITIPGNVTDIGTCAFENCSSLTSINVSSDNNKYLSTNGVLFNKNKTELICFPAGKSGVYIIPDSVTSIGDSAFKYSYNLAYVIIPDSVTSITDNAFYGCNSYLIIYGFENSYAEEYANNNLIEFQAIKITTTGASKIDYSNKLVVIDESEIDSLDNYVIVDKLFSLNFTKSDTKNKYFGTGSMVDVCVDGVSIMKFTCIVTGDLDGDGVCDVLDVTLAERVANKNATATAEQIYAANGCVSDEIDVLSYQNVVNLSLS